MAANAAPGAPPNPPPEVPPSRSGGSTSPIAVVWCRQVDNEAESPGYTTVPEDFPGQHETLEVIRTVGHLTVNVADTHDYWDPDPSQPLSYYPNIFLYPAYNGRYTCLGRMFLSTEDRPRLGMKTLVLDTAQLLASGDFGGTILRWHASMGGPRRDGSRSPPIPNPALYNVLGEGLMFHRGSTDPVLVVAADEWEPSMQAVLDLIRLLPASLISLGAILAFPYFLPQPKTNLHEFAEQLPLALALMRIPRGEAAGDRHTKRMASWEGAPVTLRDLTDGIPMAPKGKENVPLVLQYARDHQDAKLLPISQRVDLVEGPRLRAHLSDAERQGGRDRRKEMWRIGTAMESAALLLQRSRGRHVPVNVETAKRAQEYLQARLPESDMGASSPPEPAVIAAPSASSGAPAPGIVPPWLSRPSDPTPPPAPPVSRVPEVVPVSVSDDPSLLRAPAPAPLPTLTRTPAPPSAPTGAVAPAPPAAVPPPPTTGPPTASPFPVARPVTPAPPPQSPMTRPAIPPAPSAAPPTSSPMPPPRPPGPVAPPIDVLALRQQIEQDMVRLLNQRLAALPAPPVPGPATALDEKLRSDLEARADARLLAAQQQSAAQLANAVSAVEGRQSQLRAAELAQSETRLRGSVREELSATVDRRLGEAVEPKLQELSRRVDDASARLAAAQLTATGQLNASVDRRLGEAVEPKLQELSRRMDDASARLAAAQLTATGQLNAAVDAAEARILEDRSVDSASLETRLRDALQSSLNESIESRLTQRLEPRVGELSRRIDDAVQASVAAGRDDTRAELTKNVEALKNRIAQAEQELRANLLAQMDLQIREAEEREGQSRVGMDARLDAALAAYAKDGESRRARELKELEQRLNLLVDGRSREAQEHLGGVGTQLDAKLAAAVQEQVGAAEQRVGAKFDAQINESTEARVHAVADLQVRLQAYFDQRLREEQERERQKYVELLSRMKGEVDSSLARMVDSSRFDTTLREKLGHSLEAYRAETQRAIESRIATAEQQLKVDQTDVAANMARLEQLLEERRGDVTKVEETLRAEVEDLDRRSQILADRLVPVVRKTWLRVVELQKGGGSPETDLQINQLRREFTRELQRLEGETVERTTEIRDRMESAISNQGRVWLTLIRQLSQLSDDRRTLDRRRPATKPSPMDRADSDVVDSLEGIPGVYEGDSGDPDEDDPVNPMDPDPEEPTRAPPRTPGRTPRRPSRRASQ
jgi:hypothetical protein